MKAKQATTRRPNTEKLNRYQKLLTAEQRRNLPQLRKTDGQGDDAIAHVKFFLGAYTWYATEYDPNTGTFFGLVFVATMRDQMPEGELGYFSAAELAAASARVECMNYGAAAGFFSQPVERDIHFKPCTIGEVKAKLNPRRNVTPPADDCDCKLCQYIEAAAAEVETETEITTPPAVAPTTTPEATIAHVSAAKAARDKYRANYDAIDWGNGGSRKAK